jgi:SAM-dependent methyltransferase
MMNIFRKAMLAIPLAVFCSCGIPVAHWTSGEVPFVPTTPDVIDRMLTMAQVKSGDVIYDIGSGDGAIIVYAAKKYGIRGVGIEIDGDLILKARNNAFKEIVEHLVEFREQDAFTADVSPATVVTLYMLPEFNAKLRPMLEKQLKPGTRIVSHDFEIRGWTPERVEHIPGHVLHDHTIMLFEMR